MDEAKLDVWIVNAKSSLVSSFATGVLKDRGAVRAAIIQPWSNGQVEAQIAKLKGKNEGGGRRHQSNCIHVKSIVCIECPDAAFLPFGYGIVRANNKYWQQVLPSVRFGLANDVTAENIVHTLHIPEDPLLPLKFASRNVVEHEAEVVSVPIPTFEIRNELRI